MSDKFTLEIRRNGQKVPPSQLRKAAEQLSPALRQSVLKIANAEMLDYLKRVQHALRQKHSTPYRPGSRPIGDGLFKRSGRGLDAINRAKVTASGRKVEASFRLPKHLAQMEFGGIINAKKRYLAIPLPAALDANGMPLRFSPRQWKQTFVVEGSRGLVICTRRGLSVVPLYALRRSVFIPERLGLRKELREEAEAFRHNLQRKIRALMKRGNPQ